MPELPEVEITARLLDRALVGARIESALAPGINALKTFTPPLSELEGRTIAGVRRRGKNLIIEIEPSGERRGEDGASNEATGSGGAGAAESNDAGAAASMDAEAAGSNDAGPVGSNDFGAVGSKDVGAVGSKEADAAGPLALLIHLMSAGRLQLFDTRAGPRDRTSRLLVRLADGRELRLREFGSKQAAWVKLLRLGELDADEALAKLGPEAWPNPAAGPDELKELLDAPRPLHPLLRDQRTIAGIGRSWVDEILWRASLSPYKRGADLSAEEAARLRDAIVTTLGDAIAHYESVLSLPIPDKLPMPLQVHRRETQPCPRCGATLQAVHFEDYVIAYCPACQTDGRVLKDRRLSRLLK